MDKIVHYLPDTIFLKTACGCEGRFLRRTIKPEEVTCKNCLVTYIYRHDIWIVQSLWL